MDKKASVMKRMGRWATFGFQYALVTIVLLLCYMYIRGFEYHDAVVVEDSAYFLIFFVIAQLLPIGIRCWFDWKVPLSTLLLISIQFVVGSYLQMVYHHFVSGIGPLILISLISFTLFSVLSLYIMFKMVARAGEVMMNLMFEEYEAEQLKVE